MPCLGQDARTTGVPDGPEPEHEGLQHELIFKKMNSEHAWLKFSLCCAICRCALDKQICYHSCSSRMDWLPEINWKKIAALKHGEVQGVKSYPQLSVVEEIPKWHRGEKAEATWAFSLMCPAGTHWHCKKLISNLYLSSRGFIFTPLDFDAAVPVPGG